uniref:Uncharacterized protein n=1 Tax=Meloidogyne incognita TaxID=6306 RepID=A0A914NSZ8_MELIC
MSQIGQPMKTADLYDQPPPAAASAAPPPPANDLYEQPPPIDDGKQSTAVTKSEEAQRPTTNPTQKGEYENIDDMQERKKRENKRGRSMASLIHQRVRLHLKPAKKNVDVEQPVVKVQPKPQPKPKKKVVVKNKCCCVLLSFLTLLSFALALFTSLAAFCQLEE